MTRQVCNLATQEAEAGGSQIQGQPGQICKTLSQNKIFKRVGLWLSGRTLFSVQEAPGSICSTTPTQTQSKNYYPVGNEQRNVAFS